MLQITLTAAEAAVLRETLDAYLSDLRMEVAGTDAQDYREQLKEREVVLTRILRQLGR